MVVGDVQAYRGQRRHGAGGAQLEGGQFDGESPGRAAVGAGYFRDGRIADVSYGLALQTPGVEDGFGHGHGGGLAVGPRHAQPRGRAPAVEGPQAPGQLDLAPHRDPGARRSLEERADLGHGGGRNDDVGLPREGFLRKGGGVGCGAALVDVADAFQGALVCVPRGDDGLGRIRERLDAGCAGLAEADHCHPRAGELGRPGDFDAHWCASHSA